MVVINGYDRNLRRIYFVDSLLPEQDTDNYQLQAPIEH